MARLVLLALLLVPASSQGAWIHRCLVSLTDLTEPYVVKGMYQNLEGREIRLSSSQAPSALQLGARVGFGFHSGIYDLLESEGVEDWHSQPIIAKVPHVAKIRGGWLRTSFWREREINAEQSAWQNITKAYPDISRVLEASYSTVPRWSQPPIVPILESRKTELGTLLIKPKITPGAPEKAIDRSEVEVQLKELFRFARATADVTGLSLDLRPSNIAWILDPAVLMAIGADRPGFVLIEAGLIPLGLPNIFLQHMSETEFAEFAERSIRNKAKALR